MPAPLPVPLRQQILQRHQRGQSAPDIAWELGLSARTVRSLLGRLKDRGPAGLAPSYRRGHPDPSPAVQQAIDSRRLHPSWGAQYIRTRLLLGQPQLPLPSARTLLRHFARLGLTPAKPGRKPARRYRRAEQPHQVWQMDAAEMVKLRTGQRVCWLRLVDQCSGAFLQTRVFPPRRWASVKVGAVREALRDAFERWGLPGQMRVDNGYPWAPAATWLPTWLCG